MKKLSLVFVLVIAFNLVLIGSTYGGIKDVSSMYFQYLLDESDGIDINDTVGLYNTSFVNASQYVTWGEGYQVWNSSNYAVNVTQTGFTTGFEFADRLIDNETWSLAMWVKSANGTQLNTYLASTGVFEDAGGGYGRYWEAKEENISFQNPNAAGDRETNAFVGVLGDDRWHLIVTTMNGTNISHYTDGSLTAESPIVGDLATASRNWTFYMSPTIAFDHYFEGALDKITLYNYALTLADVIELNTTTNPGITVILDYPADQTTVAVLDIEFNGTYSPRGTNLTNATYRVWNSTDSLINQTTVIVTGNVSNSTNLTIYDFVIGTYSWNIEACGVNSTDTICEQATSNSTFSIGAVIDAEEYNISTYETQEETFRVNITLVADSNLYGASLVFNGSSYLATKTSIGTDRYRLERTIDIPLLSNNSHQNISLYWALEYLDTTISMENTTVRNITVHPLIFTLCNSTYNDPLFINYTTFNESNRTEINASFDATWTYWLGSGTVVKNYSVHSQTEEPTYGFCSNQNSTLTVSSVINVESGTFNERTFYFNRETYYNTTTNVNLSLHDGARSIIVQVRDSGLVPIEGYFVEIRRYYPEVNVYEVIERAKTDEYGQFVARLEEPNIVKYRFLFKNESNTVMKETGDMTIACRTSICVLPFVIEDTTSDIERFENLTDYDWSFSFDDSLNRFIFLWNDISGVSATNRLEVKRYLWNGTTTVCNETSTDPSGTLTCDVTSMSANYQAQVFRRIGSGDERRIAFLSQKVGTEHETFGTEGLIWSFFLLMTMIVIGYWYPPIGIMIYLLGIILLMAIHVIYISPAILMAQLAIGVAFIWAFKRRIGGG